jgi:hypothetical protein
MTPPVSEPVIRRMTRLELDQRKAELEQVLEVLSRYTMDEVCAELGEISYLLGEKSSNRG